MLRNYLKIAYRTLLRYKAYTALNVLGLTLGLTCAILIYMMVSFHLSFDGYHKNADRVVRIVTDFRSPDGDFSTPGVPSPLGDAARTEIAPFEKVAMVYNEGNMTIALIENGIPTKKFKEEEGLFFVQPDIFSVLDYPILKGNYKDFNQPNVVFLTEKMALKYYGNTDVIGKILRLDAKLSVKIVGILKNMPTNTDMGAGIFASYLTRETYDTSFKRNMAENWGGVNSSNRCFALLKPNTTITQAQAQMVLFVKKHYPKLEEQKARYFKLQPINDIHFNDKYSGNIPYKMITTLGIIGILLLITACINFVNMATAQALKQIGRAHV